MLWAKSFSPKGEKRVKVLLLGFSTRGLAESIALSSHRDWQLVCLDYFGDYDLAQWGKAYSLLRDFGMEDFSAPAVLRVVRSFEYDAVAYTSGVEDTPALVEEVAAGKELLGNGGEALGAARCWEGLHRLLTGRGIGCPRTHYTWEGPLPPGQWLLKPRDSGGGIGITWARAGNRLPAGYLLQEFQDGIPASVSFLANGREAVILGMSEQLIGWGEFGARGFAYCGNIVPLWREHWKQGGIPPFLLKKIKEMVILLTRECGLRGLNGIDFLVTPKDDLLFLEVNPRYCASMELLREAYGLDLFALHVLACRGRLPEQHTLLEEGGGQDRYWAKAILYAPWDLRAGDTRGWFAAGVRDIPHPGERILAGNPLCTLLVRANSRVESLLALKEKQAWILGQVYPEAGGELASED
jgi:predicted ATP-grasp superfamily ATP-dependent carboligase